MDSERGTEAECHQNVRKNKKDFDQKVAQVLKLIKGNKEDTKGKVPEDSKRQVIKLVEDIQKQYQKLNALYKLGKISRDKKEKDTSSSSDSSTSDTDYYSSDDKDSTQHTSEIIVPSNIQGKASFKDVLTMDTKQLNEQKQESLTALRFELESKNLECRKLVSIQNQLKKRVTDLEFLIKNKGEEASLAKKKGKENEIRLTSEKKMLQNEVEALRRQKEEIQSVRGKEVNILREEINEVSRQRIEVESRLQKRSDEICNLKEEINVLKQEIGKKNWCIAECRKENEELNRMNDELKNELQFLKLGKEKEKEMLEQHNKLLQSDNEYLKLQMKELEGVVEAKGNPLSRREEELKSEMDILLRQISKQEESVEKSKMNEEKLKNRMLGMERPLSESAEEMLRMQRISDEVSRETSARKTQVHCLQKEVKSLVGEKNMLEAKNEGMRERFEQRQKEADSQIHSLNKKVVERLRISKEQGLDKPDDLKQLKSLSVDFSKQRLSDSPRFLGVDSPKWSQRSLERKIEELADKFQMNIENHVRLLYQRILVVEQMQTETKEHCKKSKEIFYEENSIINGKLSAFELKFANLRSLFESKKGKQKEKETDSDFSGRIEKLSHDIQVAQDWILAKNREVASLRQQVEALSTQKEKGEWTEKLRDKEEPRKLEIKVEYLEHLLRDREEVLLSLVEEKREAIRHLCIVIDYHRERYEDIKFAFSKLTCQRTH